VEIRIFDLFCFCDLDLDPIALIYELDQYSLEIYWMCKYELLTLKLLKVIVRQRDRQKTDRQLHRNYIPCRFAGGQFI